MLMPWGHRIFFITFYMRSSLSIYTLFIWEFIIIYFMICEVYQPTAHSIFRITIIFKYVSAEISIKPVRGW